MAPKKRITPFAVFRLVAVLVFSVGVTACGKTVHWKQEVLLQDGRVIIVERESEQTGKLFPQNIAMEKTQFLTFTNPDTGEKVSWRVPKGLKPYALDFESRIPYLILNAYTVADYNTWNCPNPPYLVYRYEGGSWMPISFEQLPAKFEKRNLVDMSKSFQRFSNDGLMTLNEQERFLKDLPIESRSISREKISPIGHGCFDSTLYRLGRQSEIDHRR